MRSQTPLILDALAKRYGVLPHEILGKAIEDIQIDYICLELGIKEENSQTERANRKLRSQGGRKKF